MPIDRYTYHPASSAVARRSFVLRQSSLKKSEWEVTPEGYRDPANASKLPGSELDNQVVEQIAGAALNA